MAVKKILLDEQIPVAIYKIRGSKYIRLSIKPDGTVRVSMPAWMPYSAGLTYINTKKSWIYQHHKPLKNFVDGQKIGKEHIIKVQYVLDNYVTSVRTSENEIIVKLGSNISINEHDVQKKIHNACIRALRMQAEKHLPNRLNHYASINNYQFKEITVKNMKGRWGSCDINKNIVLNLHLMHLPWELIDYVIHHELTHTKVMKHGPEFWGEMQKIWPDVKNHRKQIKSYQPNFTNY